MELHGLLQSTAVLMPRQMEIGDVDLNTAVKHGVWSLGFQ